MAFPSPYIIVDGIRNNPATRSLQDVPDPKLIYHEGFYYVYATSPDGAVVLRSSDLQTFWHMGYCLTPDPDIKPVHYMYWDPTPFYYAATNTWYLYYSCATAQSEDMAFGQIMRYATADNPLGPFTYRGDIELDWDDRLLDIWPPLHKWAIGPSIWEKDGRIYFFYSYKGWGEGAEAKIPLVHSPETKFGSLIFMQVFSDPETPIPGTRRLVLSPTLKEELNEKSGDSSVSGSWEYTLEGPAYFEHGDTAFLMYSGNSWECPSYFIGYATWKIDGDLSNAVFSKFPDDNTYAPLVGMNDYANGMGNNSICVTPEGKILMAYHGYAIDTSGLPDPNNKTIRRLYISEITVEDGRLVLLKN